MWLLTTQLPTLRRLINVTSLEVSVIPNTTSQDVSQGLNLVTSLVKSLNESNLTEFTAVAGNASNSFDNEHHSRRTSRHSGSLDDALKRRADESP